MPYTLRMYSVSQVSRAVGVSNTSIRNWSADYEQYLPPGANPSPGQPRQYNDADLLVFSTIATMRSQLSEAADIRAALDAGTRMEPMHRPQDEPADDEPTADAHGRAVVAAAVLENALTVQQNRIVSLETKVDELNRELRQTSDRATAAETELRVLKELYQQDQTHGRPMTFREWLAQRRR